MSASMVEVSDGTWDDEVEGRPGRWWWTSGRPGADACRVMDPILDELAEQHGGRVKFTKLNVDDNSQTAARFEILSIPTVMVFESGEVRKKLIGAQPRRRLEDELATWLGTA